MVDNFMSFNNYIKDLEKKKLWLYNVSVIILLFIYLFYKNDWMYKYKRQ
jgi:hypothetical membrane protein